MRRHERYKLLLDEMLPRKEKFPVLNKMHQIKHVVHDLHHNGLKDNQVVSLAKKLNCIIVTKNIKHFRQICSEQKVDLIGITEEMPPEELDKSLMSGLRKRKHPGMIGYFTKITRLPRKKG